MAAAEPFETAVAAGLLPWGLRAVVAAAGRLPQVLCTVAVEEAAPLPQVPHAAAEAAHKNNRPKACSQSVRTGQTMQASDVVMPLLPFHDLNKKEHFVSLMLAHANSRGGCVSAA